MKKTIRGITFTGATLLSDDDMCYLSREDREYYVEWWLRTKGEWSDAARYVFVDGTVSYVGIDIKRHSAIRPALIISNLGGFKVGDIFNIGNYEFKIIHPFLAWMHKQDIGTDIFDESSNDYESSYIENIVGSWYETLQEEKEVESKFKVGDIVRYINKDSASGAIFGLYGQTFEIKSISKSYIYLEGGYNAQEKDLVLYNRPETLKIGDVVKILDGSNAFKYLYGWIPNMATYSNMDKEFVVINTRDEGAISNGEVSGVMLACADDSEPIFYTWDVRYLKKVEKENAMDRYYNKGDVVIVCQGETTNIKWLKCHQKQVGKVLTVTGILISGCAYVLSDGLIYDVKWFKKDPAFTKPSKTPVVSKPTPSRILKSSPATIVFWDDGTKTVVKRMKGKVDDPFVAFTAALAKKYYGSNSKICKLIDTATKNRKPEIFASEKITPSKILLNNPATIVFWNDGTKTVVKREKGKVNDIFNAFVAALAKKLYGNTSNVLKIVDSKEVFFGGRML